jgi:hypothetical protein
MLLASFFHPSPPDTLWLTSSSGTLAVPVKSLPFCCFPRLPNFMASSFSPSSFLFDKEIVFRGFRLIQRSKIKNDLTFMTLVGFCSL